MSKLDSMIPDYPQWTPITLGLRPKLHDLFLKLDSGISEFTFSNIYLFRETYDYQVSKVGAELYALKGHRHGKSFFALPWGVPSPEILESLYKDFDFWKNASASQVATLPLREDTSRLFPREDRDNWDYLYLTSEMADLEGKKFHKKRNLIHQFHHEYGEVEYRPLVKENIQDGLVVLDHWATQRDDTGDLAASREAINLFEELGLTGGIFYLDGKPVGYNLGEAVHQGQCFVIHFEKADNQFKGIYQTIFQHCARLLLGQFEFINREQDLGDPGLRQAKDTYRPVDFVKKFQIWNTTEM